MERSFLVNFSETEFKALLKETLREIMQEVKPTAQAVSEILDVKQAANYLRLKVTTLYEKTSRKLIPHFKKGNKLLFKRAELEAWISEGKVKSAGETVTDAATYVLNKKRK
jgi:excisionase family DNA binding protein